MNKKVIIIIGIILVVILAVVLVVFGMKKGSKENTVEKTQESTTSESANNEEVASNKENINNEENTNNEESTSSEEGEENNMEQLTGKHNAEINIKDYGTIKLELDADVAPITVTNFVKLSKEGFYNGLTFHRIISGFMMQGGDPKGDGTGGSDKTIKGEFSSNGVQNSISHKKGVISMARSQDPDSASSQFFIMHEDGEFLDGSYAAFGKVTSGQEIVDKICETVEAEDPQSGLVSKENQPVIESINILD